MSRVGVDLVDILGLHYVGLPNYLFQLATNMFFTAQIVSLISFSICSLCGCLGEPLSNIGEAVDFYFSA